MGRGASSPVRPRLLTFVIANVNTLDLKTVLPFRARSTIQVLFFSSISTGSLVMAITAKAYPRATVKKIVKGHANKSLSRDVDALVRQPPHLALRLESRTSK